MNFEWNSDKAENNAAKHGVAFETVRDFDFDTAIFQEDDRADYGETRYVALGLVGRRVHVLTFTMRGDTVRVISFRKANKREKKAYDQSP